MNLIKFLEAFNDESPEIKKVVAETVKTFRRSRDPEYWNSQTKKLISLGVNPQKISEFRI